MRPFAQVAQRGHQPEGAVRRRRIARLQQHAVHFDAQRTQRRVPDIDHVQARPAEGQGQRVGRAAAAEDVGSAAGRATGVGRPTASLLDVAALRLQQNQRRERRWRRGERDGRRRSQSWRGQRRRLDERRRGRLHVERVARDAAIGRVNRGRRCWHASWRKRRRCTRIHLDHQLRRVDRGFLAVVVHAVARSAVQPEAVRPVAADGRRHVQLDPRVVGHRAR